MTPTVGRFPPRHELSEIDGPALAAAAALDKLLAEAREREADRWIRYFAPLPDRLRDDPIPGLRGAARLVRAAFGPKDSVRDALSPEVTEPALATADRLLKAIARYEAHQD